MAMAPCHARAALQRSWLSDHRRALRRETEASKPGPGRNVVGGMGGSKEMRIFKEPQFWKCQCISNFRVYKCSKVRGSLTFPELWFLKNSYSLWPPEFCLWWIFNDSASRFQTNHWLCIYLSTSIPVFIWTSIYVNTCRSLYISMSIVSIRT